MPAMTPRTKLGALILVFVAVCLAGGAMVLKTPKASGLFWVLPHSLRSLAALEPEPSLRMTKLPNVYLWAWERPEDLRFLPQGKVGVAFLAKTISPASMAPSSQEMTDDQRNGIFIRPRLQPLRISPDTPLIAVTRIETSQRMVATNYGSGEKSPIPVSASQIAIMANVIADTATIPGVTAIQIDFDATASEHNFYRALLLEVRKRLPSEIPLSITALASWCIGDRWLEQLPPGTIDEAVPMLFRMGAGERKIENYVSTKTSFRVTACNSSVGVSTDEAFSRGLLDGNYSFNKYDRNPMRVYVFNPRAWDQAQAEVVLREVGLWRAN